MAITDIRPQPGPQESFLSSTADVVIYGGAAGGGKSWALLMDPIRWVRRPYFRAAILRRTYPEISNPGALWDESQELYAAAGGVPNKGKYEWRFEPDAVIAFRHCQHEKDLAAWHGAQIDCLYLDELTHFTRRQFFYLLSRNRGKSGVKPYVRGTCNPDAASWVAEFISWWIDPQTGYAIKERSGVVRWFIVLNDIVHWAASPEQLIKQFADQHVEPKSFTFIPATLEDNPKLLERNPGYVGNLMAQRHVDKERLGKGNWKIVDDEGAEWPAEYFVDIFVDRMPDAFEFSAIGVDPSKGAHADRGDYSAIVFAGVCGSTIFVDSIIERMPAEKIIRKTSEMSMFYRSEAVGIEAIQFQELLSSELIDYQRRERLPAIDVQPLIDMAKKEIRIRRLGPWLAQGRIKFVDNPSNRMLVQQIQSFPIGDFDDGPDALEMAIRMLSELAAYAQTSDFVETI